MGEFVNGLHERVTDTTRSLATARETGDDYAVELHTAELIDLTRLAREHGLDLTAIETAYPGIDLTALESKRADDVAESA